MPIANYTSEVSAVRSAGEIIEMLVKAGARGVVQEYGPDQRMNSMGFTIVRSGTTMAFSLPVRSEAVRQVLIKQKVQPKYQTAEHADRVAWRILRDWIRAQMAIIETEMVSIEQVMLPYMRTDDGSTMFERFESTRALTAGKAS
jgi:hypothetical protein